MQQSSPSGSYKAKVMGPVLGKSADGGSVSGRSVGPTVSSSLRGNLELLPGDWLPCQGRDPLQKKQPHKSQDEVNK